MKDGLVESSLLEVSYDCRAHFARHAHIRSGPELSLPDRRDGPEFGVELVVGLGVADLENQLPSVLDGFRDVGSVELVSGLLREVGLIVARIPCFFDDYFEPHSTSLFDAFLK